MSSIHYGSIYREFRLENRRGLPLRKGQRGIYSHVHAVLIPDPGRRTFMT